MPGIHVSTCAWGRGAATLPLLLIGEWTVTPSDPDTSLPWHLHWVQPNPTYSPQTLLFTLPNLTSLPTLMPMWKVFVPLYMFINNCMLSFCWTKLSLTTAHGLPREKGMTEASHGVILILRDQTVHMVRIELHQTYSTCTHGTPQCHILIFMKAPKLLLCCYFNSW